MRRERHRVLAAGLVVGVIAACAVEATAQTGISACQTLSSGSYVLTQDIFATGDCLEVMADDVTIDLKGFQINGNGTGTGVKIDAPRKGLAIRNGTVRDFQTGIGFNGNQILVEKIRAIGNQVGIAVGARSIVKDCIAFDNASVGITAGTGSSTLTGNIVSGNGSGTANQGGLTVGNNSLVSGNVVNENDGTGMDIGLGSTVLNNTVNNNSGTGVAVTCVSNLIGNMANGNGTNRDLRGQGCRQSDNVF
jgi:large repetitive protein